MKVFKDRLGREWMLALNVYAIRDVKARTGVDALVLLDEGMQPLARLLADPCKLCDVLWVLVEEQAGKVNPKITDRQFGEGMAGDAIQEAAEAFTQELIDFFPHAARRENLKRVQAKARTAADAAEEISRREIEAIDPQAMVEASYREWKSRSGGSPASSASTPDPSPTGS